MIITFGFTFTIMKNNFYIINADNWEFESLFFWANTQTGKIQRFKTPVRNGTMSLGNTNSHRTLLYVSMIK